MQRIYDGRIVKEYFVCLLYVSGHQYQEYILLLLLYLVNLKLNESSDFFEAFVNKFMDKEAVYKANKLKIFREDCTVQVMAKIVFEFNLDDATRLENLFGPEGNIKKMWLFIYLSFYDQELLMLELTSKQYADDFNTLNEFQIQKGMLAEKDRAKFYCLFKFFCLKD